MINKLDTPVTDDQITALRKERDLLSAKVKALSGLIEVGMIINSAVRLDDVMKLVMEKAQGVMDAEASSVLLINEEKNVFECPVAFGEAGEKFKTIEIPIDAGIAGWVAEHQQPQLITDAYQDSRFNAQVDQETGFRTKSILAAPLIVREKLIGVAEVINRKDGEAFTEDDLLLFNAFCRQVAIAISNARVYELEIAQQRIAQQLEAAKYIQQSFLPETLPKASGGQFSVAATSIPAKSVGGDIYDFISFQNNTLGISIGDVSGKGIPAALFMARLVSDFRLFAQIDSKPDQLLASLNKAITERSRRGMFITFLYGILHPQNGTFTYANAGHLPILRLNNKNKTVELAEKSSGIPLGVAPIFPFKEESISLNEGDTIILVTDGLIEAKNKAGEEYEFERLKSLVSADFDTHPEEMLSKIVDDVLAFTADMPQHDDLTIVIAKWRS